MTKQKIEFIVKTRYLNYKPILYARIGDLHKMLRKTLGDEKFLKSLENAEKENPKPVFTIPENIKKIMQTNTPTNTVEEAAVIHAQKSWGVYFDDIHPDVAIQNTMGEISIKDFHSGALWQKEQDEAKYKEVVAALREMLNLFNRGLNKGTIGYQTCERSINALNNIKN